MLKTRDLTPLKRQALLAAITSPGHRFCRTRDGYTPADAASTHAPVFTYRLMRSMHRGYLLAFDDARFPSSATLTRVGRTLAEQLQADAQAQAGAA